MNHLRLAALGAVAILVSACHRDDPKPEGETHHGADAAPAAQKLADVQPDGTTAPLLHGIGPLHVPISTKSEQAQKYFDQGFTLMYGFNHAEAIRSFKEAARLDPTCGICWWGVALSYGPNINAPMTAGSDSAGVEGTTDGAIASRERIAAGAGVHRRGRGALQRIR